MRSDEARENFIRARHPILVRSAFLLTGQDATAQDLVQETLIRVLQNWRRVSTASSPEAYVSKILLMTFLEGRRRRWNHEYPAAAPSDFAAGDFPDLDDYVRVLDHDVLRRALLELPPRQRAAVVLRHYQDCSEAETAQLMDCSVGTVKSLTARGLAALRAHVNGAPA